MSPETGVSAFANVEAITRWSDTGVGGMMFEKQQ